MTKTVSLISAIFILAAISVFPQTAPESFRLNKESPALSKTSNSTPVGNNISDILSVGYGLWVGTGNSLDHSIDAGNSWTSYYGTQEFGQESISAVANDHGTIWVATAHSVEKDGQQLPEGSGLKYSTDNGNTWTSIPQPTDPEDDTLLTYGVNDGIHSPKIRALAVTVAVQNLVYDIAFTPGTVWIASYAGGLRKSTDMGKTWQRVLLPSDELNSISPEDTLNYYLSPVGGKLSPDSLGGNNLNHRVFSVVAVNDSTLYVGTADGINKSTDSGVSWTKFNNQNQTNPISGNFVVALGYDQFNNSVWAATWKAEGSTESYGVSYTTDGGQNWKTTLDGEKVHNFGFWNDYVIAPSDDGAFMTNNGGSSWLLPGSVTDSRTGLSIKTNIYYAAAIFENYVWLGTADGMARLSHSGGVQMWNGDWNIYLSSQKLSSASSGTYAYPNPFNPRTDILKIKYSTNGQSEPVTIRIFDFGMHYVRTVIQNAQRGDPVHSADDGVIDYWDGKDESGSIVPNGVYFYRVDAGSDSPVYGKILVIR